MNTQIQVEHAVTEEATGIDLIKEQIQVSSGNRLSFTQRMYHLVNMRLNAEFVPKTLRKTLFPHPEPLTCIMPLEDTG